MRALGSGWQLSPMFTYTSALPFNVLLNYDRNYDTSLNDRPAGLGRNTARGFNFMSLDIRLSRTFAIGDRFRLGDSGRILQYTESHELGPAEQHYRKRDRRTAPDAYSWESDSGV